MLLEKRTFQKGRKTFGILINHMEGRYQHFLMRGFQEFAINQDINLIVYNGATLHAGIPLEKQMETVYQLVDPKILDGLVVSSGSMGNLCGAEEMLKFIEPFRSMPVVSIATELQGVPSVLVDNKSGVKQALVHLIEVHGFKKIAFIKGPDSNMEALERYQGYLEALDDYKIPFRPELVYSGNFTYESGKTVAEEILRYPEIPFEALVSSNDDMALALLRKMQESGVYLPKDFSLIGFDDIEEVQNLSPQFSTVRQPFQAQARKACELLWSIINGEKVPEVVRLPSRLIVRESCGCFPSAIIPANPHLPSVKKNPTPFLTPDQINSEHIEQFSGFILDSLVLSTDITHRISPELIRFLELLLFDIKELREISLALLELNEVLNLAIQKGQDIQIWREILEGIKRELLSQLKQKEWIMAAENYLQKGQMIVSHLLQHTKTGLNLTAGDLGWAIKNIIIEISQSNDLNHLMKQIERNLSFFQITFCAIVLYRKSLAECSKEHFILPQQSHIVLAINDSKNVLDKFPSRIFFSTHLVPDGMVREEQQYNLAVLPLLDQDHIFGYMMINIGMQDFLYYEILRGLIGNAIYTALLIKEEKETKEMLKDAVGEITIKEERFRSIAYFSPIIIAETDTRLHFLYINNAGKEAFGIVSDKLIGNQGLLDLVVEGEKTRLKRFGIEISRGSIQGYQNFRFQKPDGTLNDFLCQALAVYEEGMVVGLRWSFIDWRPMFTSVVVPEIHFFEEYRLSTREREVINAVLQGYKASEIANRLFIAESTVRDHFKNIYTKLDVNSREGLINKVREYQVENYGSQAFVFIQLAKLIKEFGNPQ